MNTFSVIFYWTMENNKKYIDLFLKIPKGCVSN